MKCRDCELLSSPQVIRGRKWVRCSRGVWDKLGVVVWYSHGQSQLNRGPVKRFGEACRQGRQK